MIELKLPYPPSVNHYYGRVKNRVYLKPSGQAYRSDIKSTLWQCIGKDRKWDGEPMHGDLMVEIIIYPPDKRKRDIDNIKKALFDALQHAGLYLDDNQICDDHTIRINKVVKGGLIDFRIKSANSRNVLDDSIDGFLKGLSL